MFVFWALQCVVVGFVTSGTIKSHTTCSQKILSTLVTTNLEVIHLQRAAFSGLPVLTNCNIGQKKKTCVVEIL